MCGENVVKKSQEGEFRKKRQYLGGNSCIGQKVNKLENKEYSGIGIGIGKGDIYRWYIIK